MADLSVLQDFAAAQGFDLTNPLDHDQVVSLAEYWLPRIFFYEEEKFHPISLDEVIGMVEDLFGQLPPDAQSEWQVGRFVRTGPASGEARVFDPPVVHVPDGSIPVGDLSLPVVRVLNDGSPTREALAHPDANGDAVISHGASFRRSSQFFGGNQTASGGAVAATGDPFLPRATTVILDQDGDEKEVPVITVLASFKNLLETLKYELAVEEADDYPPDGLRGGFDIAAQLFRPVSNLVPLPSSVRRQVLLDLIAAHESGESLSTALEGLPPGWILDEVAWDTVTRYAFLEYDFFYAYNDFERVQTTPFDNEHEGDDEGCCLVFDRNVINLAAAGDAPDSLLRAVPHSIITSVHEESQDADRFRFIPPPVPLPDDPDRLPRDDMDLNVYVAWGSHATYLTPGDHDLVDLGDVFGLVQEEFPLLMLVPPVVLAAALIVAIIDHFVDTEDKTSEDGIFTAPEDALEDDALAVLQRLLVMPMSADRHIYQPSEEDLLRLRAFAGKWGGHDGLIDKSPRFKAKTGRYFRRLLAKL
jgi:hypothetical protein